MIEAVFSRSGGADCIRVLDTALIVDGAEGLKEHVGFEPARVKVRIRAQTVLAIGELPSMVGRVFREGHDLCFVPRYPFITGAIYSVLVDDVIVADLVFRATPIVPTTEVLDIWPRSTRVPRNLLRFYLLFSAPMSEGQCAAQVHLLDGGDEVITGAVLPMDYELWDTTRCRLTVLLDPARIKRGLTANREAGYALKSGESFRLVVGADFRDAQGAPLRTSADRRYIVGNDQRGLVDPRSWTLGNPSAATREPLHVDFGRSLDPALLARCIRVLGPSGRAIHGTPHIGPDERSWYLTPAEPWEVGAHRMVVDSLLEDLAGNSVCRVFDRDLTQDADQPRSLEPVAVAFQTRATAAV